MQEMLNKLIKSAEYYGVHYEVMPDQGYGPKIYINYRLVDLYEGFAIVVDENGDEAYRSSQPKRIVDFTLKN